MIKTSKLFYVLFWFFLIFNSQLTFALKEGINLEDCVSKMAAGEWCEITGSEPSNYFLTKDKVKPNTWGWNGSKSIIQAWTGMTTDGRYYYLMGGGHADYAGNEVYRYDPIKNIGMQLTEQSPMSYWYGGGADIDGVVGLKKFCRSVDARVVPPSTHTYDGVEYNKDTNEIILAVMGSPNNSCIKLNIISESERYKTEIEPFLLPSDELKGIYALSLDTLKWRKILTKIGDDKELFLRTEFRGTDNTYFFGGYNFTYYGKIEKGKPLTVLGKASQIPMQGEGVLAWDKTRNKFWDQHNILVWSMDENANIKKRINIPDTDKNWSWVQDYSTNQFVKWNGANTLHIYTPETDTWCDETSSGGRQFPPLNTTAGWVVAENMKRIYTKFKYIPDQDIFIGVNRYDKPWLVHKRSHTCRLKRAKREGKTKASDKKTLAQRIIQSKKNESTQSHVITTNQEKLTLAQRIKRMENKQYLESKKPIKKREQKVITSQKITNKKAWSLNPPFGGVSELQAIGLLPKYGLANKVINPDTNIDWSGTAGERDEIGLFPEQHAAFIAGQTNLKDSILEVALAPPPNNKDNAHAPNEFWLPYLLTGNAIYVANMERSWYLYKTFYKGQPLDSALIDSYGRLQAWNLRELTQLAYLESKGLTKEKVYIKSLNATRDRWLGIIEKPRADQTMFNVLDFNGAGVNTHGWTGWMQSMLGQAINYTAYMHKDAGWKKIAAWHFQQLLKSSGDKWPLKALGYSHVFMYYYMPQGNKATRQEVFDFAQTATWDTVRPWPNATKTDEYKNLDPNHIAPKEFRTPASIYVMVVPDRFQYAYGWARLACYNKIERACEKADKIQFEFDRAGYSWQYKSSFIDK